MSCYEHETGDRKVRKFFSDHKYELLVCFSLFSIAIFILYAVLGPAPYMKIEAHTKLDIDNYMNNPHALKTDDKLVIKLMNNDLFSYSNLTLKVESKYLNIIYEKDEDGYFVNEKFDLPKGSSKEFEFDLDYSNFPSTLKNDYIVIEVIDNKKNTRKTKRINYNFCKISWSDSSKLFWYNLIAEPRNIDYPTISTKQIHISLGILIVAILSLLFGPGILKRKE